MDEDAPGFFQLPRKFIDYCIAQRAKGFLIEQDAADDEEAAEEVFEEELAAWSERRARIDAGLPLDDATPLDTAAPAVPAPQEDDAVVDNNVEIDGGAPSSWGLQTVEEPRKDGMADEDEVPVVLCTRCYSLRHYGQVRSALAEAHMPDFELGHKVGRKIGYQRYRRAVLVCVVDVTDFDGSLPRMALQQVLETCTAIANKAKQQGDEQEMGVPLGFRFVLAVNKIDLLPGNYSPRRLENWIRARAKQGGLPKPDAVQLLSSTKGKGALDLHGLLKKMLGPRGDVWVIGAQNAGKSSLINSMRRCAKLPPSRDLTTAVLPGTTLGMMRVDKVFLGQGHLYDTPGVPHPYQLTSRLTMDEVKLVLPRSRLRPRTFRIGVGQSVLIGAVAQVDVTQCPHATMYITIWASSDIPLWMGKTVNAEERRVDHMGKQLYPPCTPCDPSQPPEALTPTDVPVAGDTWTASSMDVAIAGLGWVAVGVTGQAGVRVWAPSGVAITVRKSMLPEYAKEFDRPGFSKSNPKRAGMVGGSGDGAQGDDDGSVGAGKKVSEGVKGAGALKKGGRQGGKGAKRGRDEGRFVRDTQMPIV